MKIEWPDLSFPPINLYVLTSPTFFYRDLEFAEVVKTQHNFVKDQSNKIKELTKQR